MWVCNIHYTTNVYFADMTADEYIRELKLESHVEGGAFHEHYRSTFNLKLHDSAFGGNRSASTAIYFLLKTGQFSAFHRILSDELWHFYDGDPLHVYEIKPDGTLVEHVLGRDINNGQVLCAAIPADSWFGSRCETAGGFSLCGCTVSPGFDFTDFELAERAKLTAQYPNHANLIKSLTYD